jgi:uncharacterized DUF497 family protein
LDFDRAQLVWQDPDRLETPARLTEGEERYLMIGRIEDKVWTVALLSEMAGFG